MSSGADASVSVRVAAGSLTGALAAAAFTPLDVLRLRSQLTPRAHPALDVLGGLRKLAASEGSSALWRGARMNVSAESGGVNLGATRASVRWRQTRRLRDERGWREDDSLHVTAALAAGAIAQTFVQPLCAARTRIFVGQRPASGSCTRSYFAGLLRQGPVLAVTPRPNAPGRRSAHVAPCRKFVAEGRGEQRRLDLLTPILTAMSDLRHSSCADAFCDENARAA